jgi:hypothetical protein
MTVKPEDLEKLKADGLSNLAELLESAADKEEAKADAEDDEDEDEGEDKKEAKCESEINFASLAEGFDLPAEFLEKAEVAFKHAVNEQAEVLMQDKYAALDEKVSAALVEQEKEADAEIDAYLSFVAEEWVNENAVELENNIKVQLAESFIDGLRKLFVEHNIDIPDESVSMVEQTKAEYQELKGTLLSAIARLEEAEGTIEALRKEAAMSEITKDMTEAEAEKFVAVVESLGIETADELTAKAKVLVEGFRAVGKKTEEVKEEQTEEVASEEVVTESVKEIEVPENKEEVKSPSIDPKVAQYLAYGKRGK